jgi:hypothetical protein
MPLVRAIVRVKCREAHGRLAEDVFWKRHGLLPRTVVSLSTQYMTEKSDELALVVLDEMCEESKHFPQPEGVYDWTQCSHILKPLFSVCKTSDALKHHAKQYLGIELTDEHADVIFAFKVPKTAKPKRKATTDTASASSAAAPSTNASVFDPVPEAAHAQKKQKIEHSASSHADSAMMDASPPETASAKPVVKRDRVKKPITLDSDDPLKLFVEKDGTKHDGGTEKLALYQAHVTPMKWALLKTFLKELGSRKRSHDFNDILAKTSENIETLTIGNDDCAELIDFLTRMHKKQKFKLEYELDKAKVDIFTSHLSMSAELKEAFTAILTDIADKARVS